MILRLQRDSGRLRLRQGESRKPASGKNSRFLHTHFGMKSSPMKKYRFSGKKARFIP
jgi:hypothetical protein